MVRGAPSLPLASILVGMSSPSKRASRALELNECLGRLDGIRRRVVPEQQPQRLQTGELRLPQLTYSSQ